MIRPPAALPDPVDLGFSEKFQSWYSDQITAIDKAVLNPKRFTALAISTGGGKSVIGVASALLNPDVKRAIYLTSTKGLQDQLKSDFGTVGLLDIRGQRNYSCIAAEPGGHLEGFGRRHYLGCDEGPCRSGVDCPDAPDRKQPHVRPACLYYGAIHDARKATIVSTNYSMYLSSQEYSEGLGNYDLLILDEAHDADKELEAFLTLEITLDDARHIGTKLLKTAEVDVWRDWANLHRGALASTLERLEKHPPDTAEGAKDLRLLKSIHGKLTRLADVDPLAWILDLDGTRAKFAPMQVAKYAEQYLFRGIPHILLMSATMTRKTLQLLGIQNDEVAFWECPSRFALERRPVISINTTPSVRVDARMNADDKYMWLRRIDRLIEPRRALGRKGIIHTVSYQRVKELLAGSEHKDLMLVHDAGNTRETIQQFKRSTKPHILVSPSIVTGYDFPGDECRYQIIGKVPMPDMRGPIMSVRKELDPDYSPYLAMQKLVQACGRAMRGPQDWAECVAPETRILTHDLRWLPAGDIAEGTRLLAFDEQSELAGVSRKHGDTSKATGHRRKWRWSEVIKSKTSIMPRVRVILDDAELICTPNHPWLVHARYAAQGIPKCQVWWRSDTLEPGDKLLRLLKPWAAPHRYVEGWLAGFADGEGCLAVGVGERNRSVLRVFLSQNINAVAYRAVDSLQELGFDIAYTFRKGNAKMRDHTTMTIQGGVCETLRFLGQIRPVRLMDKFLASERKEDLRRVSVSTVLAVEKLPDGPICSFQTSTKTYLAEGFGAHNTFIVDDHLIWFLPKYKKHAPKWFLESVEWVESFPEPMDPEQFAR